MIEGQIDGTLFARISVATLMPDDSELELEAIIDTGFNGQLTLPQSLIEQLQLLQVGRRTADLGDDSMFTTEVHLGAVLWDGEPRPVMVLRGGKTPLIGMELMQNYRLTIEIQDGGAVCLEEIA